MKTLVNPVLRSEEIKSSFFTLVDAVFEENREVVRNLLLNEDEGISQSLSALFLKIFFDFVVGNIMENGLPSEPEKAFIYGKILSFLFTDDPINSFQQYLKNFTEDAINDILRCFSCIFDIIKNQKEKFQAGDLFRFCMQ